MNMEIMKKLEKHLWRNVRRKRKNSESLLSKDMQAYRQIAGIR